MQTEQEDLRTLLERNTQLLEENNRLLKQIHRAGVIGFWLRILWYLILLGLPFVLYFYVLQPYIAQLGSSYQNFSAQVQGVPGWKEVLDMINTFNNANRQH